MWAWSNGSGGAGRRPRTPFRDAGYKQTPERAGDITTGAQTGARAGRRAGETQRPRPRGRLVRPAARGGRGCGEWTAGWSMVAISSMRPAQRRQRRTSLVLLCRDSLAVALHLSRIELFGFPVG